MVHFNKIFLQAKPVIAMVHLQAMPGTPCNILKPQQIIEKALKEAEIYAKYGVDALLIENMHDVPYMNGKATAQTISIMAIIGYEIKKRFGIPTGIQVLAGANTEAMGIALSSGMEFIRAEGFVFGHLADEGYMDSCAAELLRYRKNIDANHIAIFTDIKKKHSSHALTADVSIAETAKAADFFLADGLIVTGSSTGYEPSPVDLTEVRKASILPLLIGSGINIENINRYYSLADGFIVGSHFKENEHWKNPVEPDRVNRFMQTINELRR